LDKRAANFDVHAVNSCDSCCIFPKALLKTNFSFDTLESFSFGAEYTINEDRDTIRLFSIRLPFSDFTFSNSSKSLTVLDTMRNVVPRTKDDFLLVESSDVTNIGFTDFTDSIKTVDFTIGFDKEQFRSLEPHIDLHPSIRALETIGRFYDDSLDVYAMAELSLLIGDSTRQLLVLDIADPKKQINYEPSIEPMEGFPWNIPIDIDIKQMLVGIDSSQPNEVMAQTIGLNISAAISGK